MLQTKRRIAGSDPIVIEAHAGGLGDLLIYSTLPERYARAGYTVYICNKPPVRNAEAKELVWGRNPFVSGYTDATANVGAIELRDRVHGTFFGGPKRYRSVIEAYEAAHGFEPANVYPRVYYQPRFITEFRSAVVADPRGISSSFPPALFDGFVQDVCRWQKFDWRQVIRLDSRHAGFNGAGALQANPSYRVRDIFEYADIIYSCRAFLVTESGGSGLASAIRGHGMFPRVFALMSTQTYNDRQFVYDNITYWITGRTTADCANYPLDIV